MAAKSDDRSILACPECGCVQEEASALLGQAQADIRNLERELRAKRALVAKLRDDQYEQRKASKHFPAALEVLKHWKERCQPNARDIHSKARVVPVLDMLDNGWTVNELLRVVDGYAAYPFVVDGQRVAEGPDAKRFVKVETIFANEDRVLAGLRLAYRATTGALEELLTFGVSLADKPEEVTTEYEAVLKAGVAYEAAIERYRSHLNQIKAEITRSGVDHRIGK